MSKKRRIMSIITAIVSLALLSVSHAHGSQLAFWCLALLYAMQVVVHEIVEYRSQKAISELTKVLKTKIEADVKTAVRAINQIFGQEEEDDCQCPFCRARRGETQGFITGRPEA